MLLTALPPAPPIPITLILAPSFSKRFSPCEPGTELEKFALDHGVDKGAINEAIDKSYHEVEPTLPYDRDFTEKYKLKRVLPL